MTFLKDHLMMFDQILNLTLITSTHCGISKIHTHPTPDVTMDIGLKSLRL